MNICDRQGIAHFGGECGTAVAFAGVGMRVVRARSVMLCGVADMRSYVTTQLSHGRARAHRHPGDDREDEQVK